MLSDNIGTIITPQAGLVPYHPEFKSLLINNDGETTDVLTYMHMYVCMYVRMHVCMYVCMHLCMYMYVSELKLGQHH